MAIKAGVTAALFAALAGFLLWPHDYYCASCGARRYGVVRRSVHATDTTRWLRSMGYDECDHHWLINSRGQGVIDSFASLSVPANRLGHGRETVQQLPEEARDRIIDALTDPTNRLRWAVVLVLRQDASAFRERDSQEWQSWIEQFQHLFAIERDPAEARAKKAEIAEAFRSTYGWEVDGMVLRYLHGDPGIGHDMVR